MSHYASLPSTHLPPLLDLQILCKCLFKPFGAKKKTSCCPGAPSDSTGPISLFLLAMNSHKMRIWKLLELKLKYRQTGREWTGLWGIVTYPPVFRYYGWKSGVLAERFVVVMHHAPVIIRGAERINDWPWVLVKIMPCPCNKLRWNIFGRESQLL